jgi:hypothetical protein
VTRETPDDTALRFWAKAVIRTDGCWAWSAAITRGGYGHFWVDGHHVSAHRFAYELLVGPIPEGLTLDHLCRVRHCVNPAHLEPVTMRENNLRGDAPPARNAAKTHCVHGHPFDEENTYQHPRRSRVCQTCQTEGRRRYRERRKAQIAADPSVVEHGLLSTYNNWGCRCSKCRRANATYYRERYQRRAA